MPARGCCRWRQLRVGVARSGKPVVEGTASLIVWDALRGMFDALGFDAVKDEAFTSLVLGRIIEPTSKADTVRVLTELGVPAPTRVTFLRCLKRVVERDYWQVVADACFAHATRDGAAALVLYDVTTLYFEAEHEDGLRKVAMSKERRVDPQVTVGLLTDATGFPLQVHLFEGNKAVTKTLIPVLTAFRERHAVRDIVVVADAGMLSAANLLALEEAGFAFIVGSRISKAPYDLAEHFRSKGNAFTGSASRPPAPWAPGKAARERRVVYHYKFKRSQHDNRDQREDRPRGEGRRRFAAVEEGPVRQDRGSDQGRRLGPRRARPVPGRAEGLRHQHPSRDDDRPTGHRRVPRPVPSRTVLSDGQVRPRRPAGLPPDPPQHRSPPDRGLHRAGRLPSSSSRDPG